MRVMIIVVAMLLPISATAGRKAALRMLSFAPVAYFHETVAHETAHTLTALTLVRNTTVTEFRVWPGRNGQGKFHMAWYRVDGPVATPFQATMITLAPYALDIVAFTASDIALSRVKPGGWWGSMILVMGMAAPLVNFTFNYIGGGDFRALRDRSPAFGVVGGVLIGVGVLRLAYRVVQALKERE
jgi:hypothetical protein